MPICVFYLTCSKSIHVNLQGPLCVQKMACSDRCGATLLAVLLLCAVAPACSKTTKAPFINVRSSSARLSGPSSEQVESSGAFLQPTTPWNFSRPLRICTASIEDFGSRCNGAVNASWDDPIGSVPPEGWCPGSGDFCGYDVDVWTYVIVFTSSKLRVFKDSAPKL
jgi:hypothetical protein